MTEIRGKRMSRKGFLRVLGVLGGTSLALPLLAACQSSPAAPTIAPAAAPTIAPAAAPTTAPPTAAAPSAATATPAPAAPPAPTLVATAAGATASTGTGGHADWATAAKPFKGKTVSILMSAGPWGVSHQTMLPKFTQMTGMDVKFDMIPEGQIATKLQTSVASRSGDYDAGVMIWDMIAEYYNRGLIANLDDMIKDPQLPAFDITEFPQPIVNFLNRKGHIVGIPVSVASQIMTYRDDLLKSVNVEVKGAPTWQNIYDWAKATTKDNVVGMTAGWQGGQIYYDNMNILPGDKPFLDQNKRLSIYRDPRLIETWDLLQRMYKEGLMSKDVLNLNVYDGWVKFQQGTVATQPISWPVAVAMLEDPAKSKSAGKIGYCPTPNATPRIGGWSCHIFSDSKNKEATYTFLSWLASPENAAAEVIETGNFDSSYHKSFQTNFDAKYKADLLKRPNGANEIKALAASWDGIKTGRMVDPNTPEVTKFDQVMYPLLARVLTGDLSAKDGLNQAADAAEKILDDAGYYK